MPQNVRSKTDVRIRFGFELQVEGRVQWTNPANELSDLGCDLSNSSIRRLLEPWLPREQSAMQFSAFTDHSGKQANLIGDGPFS